MLKKYTAILFLSLASAILLGHILIPHHHHEHEHGMASHQHSHDHPKPGDSKDPLDYLNYLFSLLQHPNGGFTFASTTGFNNCFSKQLDSFIVIDFDGYLIIRNKISNSICLNPGENPLYISPNACLFRLRGPPVFTI